jgi:hypothetical protein
VRQPVPALMDFELSNVPETPIKPEAEAPKTGGFASHPIETWTTRSKSPTRWIRCSTAAVFRCGLSRSTARHRAAARLLDFPARYRRIRPVVEPKPRPTLTEWNCLLSHRNLREGVTV